MQWPRVQAFEFNDQPWAPSALRDSIVESLSRTLSWGRILEKLVPVYERFLHESGTQEVLELGAGAGGPADIIASELRRTGKIPPKILLTDLHPRVEAWKRLQSAHPTTIDFIEHPVDATQIPEHIAKGRARSIINVFHHFPPALGTAILEDAVRGSKGVFLAEGFERTPAGFVSMMPVGGPALLLNPLLSERENVAKALLTWCSPIVLTAALWDGFISTLRVYREDELRAMVEPFGSDWRWTYGTYDYVPFGRGYYFYGVPKH